LKKFISPLIATSSLALLLAVAGIFMFLPQAHTQTTPSPLKGPFMVGGGNQNMAWRIDQGTGQISYCVRDTASTDPVLIRQRPPICSAWGN
jgi:hypothetical protein